MSSAYRRYEILLPVRFSNGDPVPAEIFAQTLLEIRERFGAVSAESHAVYGEWQYEGTVHRDESSKMYVDVVDTTENRQFFTEYKETLKSRFQQLDIWMTTYPIEVV